MGSRLVQYLFLIFFLLTIKNNVHTLALKVFNVNNYGAIADGNTDNTKAFLRAWTAGCQNAGGGAVLVPKGKYLVGPVVFSGSCKWRMNFIVQGIVLAPTYQPSWGDIDRWISFEYVDHLIITGGGSLDGQGASAWPYNSCSKNPHCKQLPVSLRLNFVKHALISHIRLFNSKNFHVNIFACNDIHLDHVHIIAPGDSPNTDGIHVGDTAGIRITDSIISTGDDCLSFGPGTSDVEVSGVHCGPGHGISIGSLGKYPRERDVTHFLVKNCSFSGTQNGVRIKTWAPSQPSNVYNLTFEHIIMENVNNPIIIDQEYCPSGLCSHQGSSQVGIRDVKFRNIWGSSSSKVAVKLRCSETRPCQQIELRDIRLGHQGTDGSETSECYNANGDAYGYQKPTSCL